MLISSERSQFTGKCESKKTKEKKEKAGTDSGTGRPH